MSDALIAVSEDSRFDDGEHHRFVSRQSVVRTEKVKIQNHYYYAHKISESSVRPVSLTAKPWGWIIVIGTPFISEETSRTKNKRNSNAELEDFNKSWNQLGTEAFQKIVGPAVVAVADRRRSGLTVFRGFAGRVPLFRTSGELPCFFSTSPSYITPVNISKINLQTLHQYLVGRKKHTFSDFWKGVKVVRPSERIAVRNVTQTSDLLWREVKLDQSKHLEGSGFSRRCYLSSEIRKKVENSLERRGGAGQRVHAVSGGLDSSFLLALDKRSHPEEELKSASIRSPTTDAYESEDKLEALERCVDEEISRFSVGVSDVFSRIGCLQRNLAWGPRSYPGDLLVQGFFDFVRRKFKGRQLVFGNDGDAIFSNFGLNLLLHATNKRCWSYAARELRRIGLFAGLFQVASKYGDKSKIIRIAKDVKRRVKKAGMAKFLRPELWNTYPGDLGTRQLGRGSPGRSDLFVDHFTRWGWELSQRIFEVQSRRASLGYCLPYLDKDVLEFLAGISPFDIDFDDRDRSLLRLAAEPLLPDEITAARKSGFINPLTSVALGPYYLEKHGTGYKPKMLDALGLVNCQKFESIHRDFANTVRESEDKLVSNRYIWRTISADLWLRAVDGGDLESFS